MTALLRLRGGLSLPGQPGGGCMARVTKVYTWWRLPSSTFSLQDNRLVASVFPGPVASVQLFPCPPATLSTWLHM